MTRRGERGEVEVVPARVVEGPASPSMREWAEELVARARAEGVQRPGSGDDLGTGAPPGPIPAKSQARS